MTVQSKPPEKNKPDKKSSKQDASTQSAGNLQDFLKGVAGEWQKISWPTWPQIWGQTIVVLVMVSIMTLGLYVLDNTYRLVIGWLPGKNTAVENSSTFGR